MILGDDNRQSFASVILSRMKDGKTQESKPFDNKQDDDNQGMLTACEDMLQAVDNKDPQGLMMALKAFMSLADSDDSDEQDQE